MGVTALDAAPVFDALGDPNRLRIVIWLCEHGPCSTSTSRKPFRRHVRPRPSTCGCWSPSGLVTSAKRGRERIWTVQPQSLTAAGDYLGALSRQWDRRIDRLRALVED